MLMHFAAAFGGLCCAAATSQPTGLHASLDRESVVVGGCVALVLDKPPRDLPKELILEIEGRQPVSLSRSSPRINNGDTSVHLIWIDLEHPVDLGGTLPRLRLEPVFREPGTLKLKLRTDRGVVGKWEVRVVAPSDEAKAATRVLYPEITPQGPDNGQLACWALALAEEWERPGALVTNVNRLVETLPTVARHPDWAEIAPALVRHRVMQSELMRLLRSQGTTNPGAQTAAAGEVLDRVVAEIERTPVKTPFGRAIAVQGRLLIETAQSGTLGVKIRFSHPAAKTGKSPPPTQPSRTE
ncbi:MAG: hypothetical protein KA354_05335 [Phycisphaerae bacterium]|nr:hypothetical protein [Phycisphaerae bacterium]